MKAIVGLGNPGARYRATRHNVGFAVADEIAQRAGIEFEAAPVNALMAKWRRPDGLVLVVKPMTYMNESGQAIGELTRYYKMEAGDLLIVVDDVQLPLGRLRARARGSAGGHNGLKSAIAHLGVEFPRLRVGVGLGLEGPDGTPQRGLVDHVLARFEPEESAEAGRMTDRAADAAEMFITSGIEAVMNAYNGGDSRRTE